MLTSHRASSQATMAGVGSVDEELNAMLQSGHHSHAQTTLAGVMTPSSTPVLGSGVGDSHNAFSSSYSSLQENFSSSAHGQQLSRNMSLPGARVDGRIPSSVGPGSSGRPLVSPASRWPFEEKWVLDAKSEVLESAASLRSNVSNFGSNLESPSQGMNPPLSGGLQRYHSAPSSFLQCLADFNEDAFSQVSSPLGNSSGRESLLSSFLTDHLTPIIEGAPQQMETEKVVSGPSMNEIDQFLSTQTDYGRRAALSSSMLVGKPEIRPLARSGGLSANATDTFGTGPRPSKANLLRQSSSPADLLATIQDSMDESDPSMQIPTIMSSEDSLSGGTSEENAAGINGRTSMYSRDDGFLVNDTMTSGALWNAPTSPGPLSGKRPRGVLAETSNGTGVNAEGSLRIRVGEPGSLTRHLSLPATGRPLSPGLDLGMDELGDFSVPCRTRARRGFATHPRSIAERVRRTKISERMKKLQDLVPNMDRQTNTSDMLDEAVEYVKQLQLQVQELTNTVHQLKEMHAKE